MKEEVERKEGEIDVGGWERRIQERLREEVEG